MYNIKRSATLHWRQRTTLREKTKPKCKKKKSCISEWGFIQAAATIKGLGWVVNKRVGTGATEGAAALCRGVLYLQFCRSFFFKINGHLRNPLTLIYIYLDLKNDYCQPLSSIVKKLQNVPPLHYKEPRRSVSIVVLSNGRIQLWGFRDYSA